MKFVCKVYASIEITARSKEEAIQKFFNDIESEPQQNCASWIEDHLKVKRKAKIPERWKTHAGYRRFVEGG